MIETILGAYLTLKQDLDIPIRPQYETKFELVKHDSNSHFQIGKRIFNTAENKGVYGFDPKDYKKAASHLELFLHSIQGTKLSFEQERMKVEAMYMSSLASLYTIQNRSNTSQAREIVFSAEKRFLHIVNSSHSTAEQREKAMCELYFLHTNWNHFLKTAEEDKASYWHKRIKREFPTGKNYCTKKSKD